MNTNEVVAMIDAITEGKCYTHAFEMAGEGDSLSIETEPETFALTSPTKPSFIAVIDDPRTALEIAGALVAWAGHKDGTINARTIGAIVGDIRWAEVKIEGASENDV